MTVLRAGEKLNMATAMWDEMLRINLKSVFLCTRAVLPAMRRNRYGRGSRGI